MWVSGRRRVLLASRRVVPPSALGEIASADIVISVLRDPPPLSGGDLASFASARVLKAPLSFKHRKLRDCWVKSTARRETQERVVGLLPLVFENGWRVVSWNLGRRLVSGLGTLYIQGLV